MTLSRLLEPPRDLSAQNRIQEAVIDNRNRLAIVERRGVGQVIPYTPTWTSSGTAPALGNGILQGRYARMGSLVWVSIYFQAGSTTTYGTSFYNFALPIASDSSMIQVLNGDVLDNGTQHYNLVAVIGASATSFSELLVSSNASGPTNWGATNPFTVAVNDRLLLTGTYLAA